MQWCTACHIESDLLVKDTGGTIGYCVKRDKNLKCCETGDVSWFMRLEFS